MLKHTGILRLLIFYVKVLFLISLLLFLSSCAVHIDTVYKKEENTFEREIAESEPATNFSLASFPARKLGTIAGVLFLLNFLRKRED